ncbi:MULTISPECIES: HprK-related kinase A [Sphingobium]|jgi:HprK-related kinase A|uniref:HprK-related kinase A n=1 Tax=Sphingobium TaxID=165695 RepID=UPI000C5FEE8C|nr:MULTISPECIES: HprK-related kinase A [Sphingobium]MBS46356.1 HprK-related kinase A [Sphingobium sp.]MCC4255302.1 HprK-related kinase A [Sphingobium lactosutens]|tara:strand:+ start:6902 stop:7765 length:864 start_codon:yes stop_codon:yes gene_type:complete
MRHSLTLQIGPATFRIGSAWRQPVEELTRLYAGYPDRHDAIADFTVRLQPAGPLRRWVRPSIFITGDHGLADAAPMSLAHGLLAAEMGMNLQMALGWRRHLLLHASSVEKDGRALVMTGESGSGKSTLAALLGERGWRLMGDEFALLDLDSGAILPFPRLVSLKNQAIGVVKDVVGAQRMGPMLQATAKGDIRHLVPRPDAVARMAQGAMPAMLLFPRFGHDAAIRPVGQGEAFMRLTQASTNYVALGEPGFAALTRFVTDVPACAMDFPSGEVAFDMIDRLWEDGA